MINFDIIPMVTYDVVLKMLWLRKHDFIIDYSKKNFGLRFVTIQLGLILYIKKIWQ